MRLAQFFFIAAATTGAVHAQTTTAPAPSDTTGLSVEDAENQLGFSSALGEQFMKLASMAGSFADAYSTYTGMSSLESDFSAWVSTQTAAAGPTIPTQLPEDAEEMLRGIGQVDLMDEFLKDSGKDYLPKDVQSSFVHDMNVMVTAGKEVVSVLESQTAFPGGFPQSTGEAEEKDSAAGRVGGVGALGVALVAGIVVVVAL